MENKKKRGTLYHMWKNRWCYIALIPTFGLLLLFKLYPAISGIIRSMYRWKTKNYFNPIFNGLDNYQKLMKDTEFWQSFTIMLVFMVAGFICTFGINMPFTYLVKKLGASKWGKFFQRAFVIPMMVPGMVYTMYWRFFFSSNNGILDAILKYFGKTGWSHVWLADNKVTIWALLFMGFPFVGGFSFLILLSGFQNIDSSLAEAADLDGANALKKFLNIDLPLVIPQMKVLSVLGMIGAIQGFGNQLVMTNGRYGTMVPGLYMYQAAFTKGNYGYAAAMGVVLFIITLIITILQNKYIRNLD